LLGFPAPVRGKAYPIDELLLAPNRLPEGFIGFQQFT
jgi:hypothetical protein